MRREKLKFGVIADPIASFNPEAETTFFILKEITRRGHETRVMELKDLFIKSPLPPFVKGGGGGDLLSRKKEKDLCMSRTMKRKLSSKILIASSFVKTRRSIRPISII
ncbi:MAG: hypothetical protein HYU99_03935 [Deltaproteobacteria bacterium]|nr:hypothetical protein [Deltaproteobacteria bacterium]